jgi:DNA-binding YbaB/EbfC family protein
MPQPPNLNKMLEQAQQMLAQQQEAQEKLKDETVEATSGGGMVKVVMTGDLRLKTLAIDPDAVDPDDVEMLQDMVIAAVNEALRSAEELQQQALGAGGGGGGFDPMSALDALGMGGLGGGMGGMGGGLPGGGAPNRAARRRKR